jgi:hypothetical protein
LFVASRGEEKRTAFPSGVKSWTVSRDGCHVSRFGTPPTAGTTKTSRFPSSSALKARSAPSGLKAGFDFTPGPDVIRWTFVPSRRAVQRSFP